MSGRARIILEPWYETDPLGLSQRSGPTMATAQLFGCRHGQHTQVQHEASLDGRCLRPGGNRVDRGQRTRSLNKYPILASL